MPRFARLASLAAMLCACAVQQSPETPRLSVAGTTWHVAAVNGQATPAGSDQYFLRFEGERFSARFGCNQMGGAWRLRGRELVVTGLMQTVMGCSPPASGFESAGSAILRAPMQVRHEGAERMELANTAGSLSLERTR